MANQAGLGISDKVHNEEINEYPEDWKQDYLRMSDWVRDLYQRYGRRIVIRVIDPQSLVGMYKSLRYRIRQYPTFVIEGRDQHVGWEQEPLASLIEEHLRARGLVELRVEALALDAEVAR